MGRGKKSKRQRRDAAVNAGLAASAKKTAQNHGEAVNTWIDGYTGSPGEVGLRQLSRSKVLDAKTAGKAGEVLHKTKVNAERAMRGDPHRVARTDDVGRTNDPVLDIVERDGTGPGAQMKLGKTAQSTWNEIRRGLDKYSKADEVLVPPDQVNEIRKIIAERAREAEQKAQAALARGDHDAARTWQEKAHALQGLEEKVKPAKVTQGEADWAQKNPELATAKGVLGAAHDAGVKAAKVGSALGAGVSGAQNLAAVVKGEKEVPEAIVDTLVDTAKATAVSYAAGAAGSLVKSGLEQAGKRVASRAAAGLLKGMAKGNAPAMIVTASLEMGKSLSRYLKGEIDSRQFLSEVGEKGVGMTAAAHSATVGATTGGWVGGLVGSVIPGVGNMVGAAVGSVVGTVAGSMVGYIASTQIYQAAGRLLKEGEEKAQRRAALIAIYERAEQAMRREREELDRLIEQHYAERSAELRLYFEGVRDAILANDAHALTEQLENITKMFGGSLQYQSDEEFEQFMLDPSKTVRVRFT